MRLLPAERNSVSRVAAALLVAVFFIWTAGVHASPLYDGASVSAVVADDYGLVDSASDSSSSGDDAAPRKSFSARCQTGLTPCALVQLAFAGPTFRLLSYPGLAQAPPSSR